MIRIVVGPDRIDVTVHNIPPAHLDQVAAFILAALRGMAEHRARMTTMDINPGVGRAGDRGKGSSTRSPAPLNPALRSVDVTD